ncbi:MAG: hypothetical protein COA40_05740, partial [Aequorivita sp.]
MVLIFGITRVNAQLACATLDAGPDVTIDCSTPCTDLTASIIGLPNTNTASYIVAEPACPLPPITGGNPSNITIDDRWSNVINLPFQFTYFQNTYNQVVVAANGQVSFNLGLAGTFNGWAINPGDLIPNNQPNFPLNTIYGAFHDLDPSINPSADKINYLTTGTAPYRQFVVNFNNVRHFGSSCTGFFTTQQIILYESLNVIEVNLIDKPACTAWNDGLAVVGIMGNNLSEFAVPPGRNTGVWTATNETWRFLPNGPQDPNTVFEWTDQLGNVIGNNLTVNVCPAAGTSTYTASISFQLPNGTTHVLDDDVVVTKTGTGNIVIDLGPDIDSCSTAPILLDADTGDPNVVYEWFLNGNPLGAFGPTYTVTFPNSGIYSVDAYDPADPACVVSDSIEVNYYPQPVIDSPPLDLCDNGALGGVFDLTVNDAIVRGAQDPNFQISYYNTQLDAEGGINPIVPANAYPIGGSWETIWVRIQEPSGLCYAVDSFIIGTVAATQPASPTYICDQDGDGQVTLNLNATYSASILNGQNPLDFTVTYHDNPGDAGTGNNPLPTPYTITVSPMTMYARVVNNHVANCFAVTQFDIIIESIPGVGTPPDPLVSCDPDSDGYTEFTLHDADFAITGGDP